MTNHVREKVAPTPRDIIASEKYVQQRALLFQLWELATIYENIASRIHVRIRQAHKLRDYWYEDKFSDCAIVVNVEWIDEKAACVALSCNPIYPRGAQCSPKDDPKIFPTGVSTRLVSRRVSCFEIYHIRRQGLCPSSGCVSIRRTTVGYAQQWRMVETQCDETFGSFDRKQNESSSAVNAVDMPFLEYDYEREECSIGNYAIKAFVTQPYTRSLTHDVCRQDNFYIGDDWVKVRREKNDAPQFESGRHCRTYCSAFSLQLDPSTATCYEPWYEKILSYTFLGKALLRLVHHAIHGSDGCSETFNTWAERQDITTGTIVNDRVAPEQRSRREWFERVNRTWCLPPPNGLLSDLGIEGDNVTAVWSNVHGLTSRAEIDYVYSNAPNLLVLSQPNGITDNGDDNVLRENKDSNFER